MVSRGFEGFVEAAGTGTTRKPACLRQEQQEKTLGAVKGVDATRSRETG